MKGVEADSPRRGSYKHRRRTRCFVSAKYSDA
jgi:hypothetical protein